MTEISVLKRQRTPAGRTPGPRIESKSRQRLAQRLVTLIRIVRSKFRSPNKSRGDDFVETCIFCHRNDPNLNNILLENRRFYARYDNYPATKGHVEIVPKRHVESFFELTPKEIRSAYSLIRKTQGKLHETYAPDGYTIGVNEGTAAGRSIDHLHINLIPRYQGDVPDPRGGIRQIVPNCDPDTWKNPLEERQ